MATRRPSRFFFSEQPALRDQAEPVLELLYNEMLLSEERGEIPQLDDYLARFPQYANELRLQFEIHSALEVVDAEAAATAALFVLRWLVIPRHPEVPPAIRGLTATKY